MLEAIIRERKRRKWKTRAKAMDRAKQLKKQLGRYELESAPDCAFSFSLRSCFLCFVIQSVCHVQLTLINTQREKDYVQDQEYLGCIDPRPCPFRSR